MPKCFSITPVWRVSSAAISAQLDNTARARADRSPRLPIGVATTYSRPAGSLTTGGLFNHYNLRLHVRIQERKSMAAISRRPWLPRYAALAISLILAACSLVKPQQTTEDQQARALRLG